MKRGSLIDRILFEQGYGRYMRISTVMGIIVVAGAAFILSLGVGVRFVSHHYEVAKCNSFGVQSNREVKFVDYTFWQWDCLTPTADGKWISTSLIRDTEIHGTIGIEK